MRKYRSAAVAAASFLLVTGAAIASAPSAYAGTPGGTHANDRNTDFNGDGYDDVLVGSPGAAVGGHKGAGMVTVQYGGPKGMGTTNVRAFSQNSSGVAGAAEAYDNFGKAVAAWRPRRRRVRRRGGRYPRRGHRRRLRRGRRDRPVGHTQGPHRLGEQLAAGRRSHQGRQIRRLARRGPLLGHHTRRPAGGHGLGRTDHLPVRASTTEPVAKSAAPQSRQPHQKARTTLTSPPKNALAGSGADEPQGIQPKSMTTGDYDNNGYADLIVSGTSVGDEPGHGWSYILPGTASDDEPLPVTAVRGGPVVASGDINGDGYDDLVTGEPHSPDDGGESMTGGMVGVYYGSEAGLAGQEGPGTPPVWWTQDSPGVPGANERGDGFGTDLSVGDTNKDGFADLAIGVSGEDIGTVPDAGAFIVLRGSARGLTATGVLSANQGTANVPGAVEKGDKFGGQVSFTDPNDDGRFGLLVSAPSENTNDGFVWVFSAGTGGITTSGSWSYGAGDFGGPTTDALYGAAIDD